MDGLSEATLEKFIGMGFIHEFADLFHLCEYKEAIVEMEGFGEKSYAKLMEGIEKARKTTLPRVIYSLGIANIGLVNAKMLCKHFSYNIEAMLKADMEELSAVEGVGEVIASAFTEYMGKPENLERLERLCAELEMEVPRVEEGSQNLSGMSFVVTGTLVHYESRNELKEEIEKRGGKVAGSVTGKTICLINNDVNSASSKNKKAKELQVPILSEEDFIEKYLQ